jgi:hypothetical protein
MNKQYLFIVGIKKINLRKFFLKYLPLPLSSSATLLPTPKILKNHLATYNVLIEQELAVIY